MDTPQKNKGGRPVGSISKRALADREKAAATGLLPHEILLEIARGTLLREWYVDEDGYKRQRYMNPAPLEMRVDAAKSAAPYYAPKISTVEVIQGVNDDSLDEIIARAAAEAGVSLSTDGEGTADETEDGTGTGEGDSEAPRRRIRQ